MPVEVLVGVSTIDMVGPTLALIEVSRCMQLFVGSGIMALAGMGISAESGMSVGLAPMRGSLGSNTGQHRMTTRRAVVREESSAFSNVHNACHVAGSWGVNWGDAEFIEAYKAVKASKKFNFEGCRIPVPTKIR